MYSAGIGASARHDMDMQIVSVPVIDRDPLQAGAEVAFHLPHQVAGEAAQVCHLGRVFRGDRRPKMMPVRGTTAGELALVDTVRLGIEYLGALAVAGHPVALEVAEMGGERYPPPRPYAAPPAP
jgi:hypothetical protein